MVVIGIRQHDINDGTDAGGRRDLDGRPEAARDDLRVDLVDVVLLAKLAVLQPGHGRIDNDDVLQGLRHGVLEDALQRIAVVIEFEAVHQQAHLLAVSRVANRLVVHRLHALAVGLPQRAQPAGGVERLVELAVDLDRLESLERQHVDLPAVDDCVTEVAVLVDDAVRRPRERILEYIVGMLRQRADAQLHRA